MPMPPVDRRRFLQGVGAAAAWAALPALRAQDAAAASAARPNVLFIGVDDLNDFVSILDSGHGQTLTPNLARLAARGTTFRRAYCQAPSCCPSRASLMTGRLPQSSGTYVNKQDWRDQSDMAEGGIRTLPQQLRLHGYHSTGSGKIYHAAFLHDGSWDDYYPSKSSARPPADTPQQKDLFKGGGNVVGGVSDPEEGMSDYRVASWIGEQLANPDLGGGKPFFLACGFYRPHLPWYAPQAYFDRLPTLKDIDLPTLMPVPDGATPADAVAADVADIPALGLRMRDLHEGVVNRPDQWRLALRCYLASIAFMDAQLGRVLDALDASVHAANTVVVLWTDHGWDLGHKGDWKKFMLWEQTTRTPLVIARPGDGGGRICDLPVGLVDLYPTLLALTGTPEPPHKLDGHSLLPLLQDPARADWTHPVFSIENRGGGLMGEAVRTRQWRYIRYADGGQELYDHDPASPGYDPEEFHNLAPEADPERLASLRALLPNPVAHDPPLGATRRGGAKNADDED